MSDRQNGPPAGAISTRRGFSCIQAAFRNTSWFFTKYSTPEYTVVTTMTTQHTVLSQEMFHSSIRQMATMVEAVLILPANKSTNEVLT